MAAPPAAKPPAPPAPAAATAGPLLEIDASDVVKLVMQFLRENNLQRTLSALQEETQLSFNVVPNIETFVADVRHGRWEDVLGAVANMKLSAECAGALYEQVCLELLEVREVAVARELLRTAPALRGMALSDPQRLSRLETLCRLGHFDATEAYRGEGRDKRRKEVAELLRREVVAVAPSRLLSLLGQALKWQRHQGTLPRGARYDLFRGAALEQSMAEEERPPARPVRAIRFGKNAHGECAAFSPDGQFLVSGSSDGFVEVWDYESGRLRKDLKYQADDLIMMHADSAVLALAFSRDSELLASGTNKGEIKVWRVLTGTCVRRFEAAHSDSVTALQFSRDGTQLLSGSLDGTARIHGLKSERRLKEFRSPAGGVTGALFSADFSQVVTSSTGGVVSVWDAKTGTCLHSWRVRPDLPLPLHINSVQWLPRAEDRLVVCERSRNVYVTSASGRSVNTLSCEGKDLACCAPSPRGKFVYAVSEDGVLHAFNVATGVEERPLKLHESEVLAIAHHPHKNVVATLARDGQMLIWHPG